MHHSAFSSKYLIFVLGEGNGYVSAYEYGRTS